MRKSMKRLIAVICVASMLVGIIPAVNLGQVNATELTEEKTVLEGKITSGTVTPGNGNNEVCDEEGYVFGGYYNSYDADKEQGEQFSDPLTEAREATEAAPVYIRWVPEEVMNVKAQVRDDEEDECKLVISNCDTKSADSNLTSSTQGSSDKDNKQEGEASLCYTRATTGGAIMNIYLKETRDVTGYKYFSCKIKVENLGQADTNEDGTTDDDDECLYIHMTSTGTSQTAYALQFRLTQNELNEYKMDGENGWYDLQLPFAQAEYIASTGDDLYDGSAITFIQFRTNTTTNVKLWVDDICALNENPGFLIGDCDQLKAPNCGSSYNTANSFTFINPYKQSDNDSGVTKNKDAGEVKEGTGAIKNICYSTGIMRTLILQSDANRLDISKYEENGGYIHFWLFISDIDSIEDEGKFTITISSTASASNNCRMWYVDKADLTDGWNEIVKPLNNPDDSSDGTTLDLTQVNYFRVNTENATDASVGTAYMILDDVRIVDNAIVPITDCDTSYGLNSSSIGEENIEKDNVKQAAGAFTTTGQAGGNSTVYRLSLTNPIDFTGYKTNNYSLHFWFYIENPLYIKGDYLMVALNSDTTYNKSNDQQYWVLKENLTSGWNEIYINLNDNVNDTDTGNEENGILDWSAIQCITIAGKGGYSDNCVMMIDDISLVAGNKNTADVRFVSTVESLEYKSVGYEISQSFSPSKPLTTDTRDVYETLYELGTDGELDSVTPSGISGLNCSKRMYTATIVNLPNRLWDAVFTVIPYWVTQDGTKVTGEARELSINYAFNASRQETTPMDVYLIAGQSNAAGFTPLAYDADNDGTNEWDATTVEGWVGTSRVNGFSNVLYSGTSNTNSVAVALTKADVHGNGNMGPEVGMADALSSYYNEESGKVAGIIKYAYGGTGLLDLDHTDTACTTVGNWVSPSYEAVLIQRNGAVKHGELTGKLYENLLAQVEESLQYYRKAGYEPTIKGLYWMQGEHDRGDIYDNRENNDLNYDYTEAFTYFANDIREDLANLTGDSNLKAMPIIVGTISETFSNATSLVTYNQYFIEIQKALASAEKNIYVVDNSQYAMNELVDGESTYVQYCTDGKHWGYDKHLEIGQNVGNEFLDIYVLGE